MPGTLRVKTNCYNHSFIEFVGIATGTHSNPCLKLFGTCAQHKLSKSIKSFLAVIAAATHTPRHSQGNSECVPLMPSASPSVKSIPNQSLTAFTLSGSVLHVSTASVFPPKFLFTTLFANITFP